MTVQIKRQQFVRERKDFSPTEFMRTQHPDLFSDSTPVSLPQLAPELFTYYLDTLTSRNQETEFAYFCRRLCEKEICPNLRAQTGPMGGGDSKADSETIPVSTEISDIWVGVDPNAANERWAFAFSAKKTWKSKVHSDVAGIIGTNRGYTKIYFVTNQFAREKDRAATEDELSEKYGVPVIILDRTWMTTAVFEHDRVTLAVEALGIQEASLQNSRKIGPNDFQRQQELDELDKEIADPDRYANSKFQLAEDCLRAALLARGLERPRTEVDGLFARADRIAEQAGSKRQRLRVVYNYAWTTIFWHEDLAFLNNLYNVVETFALGSDQASDIELLQNLWQVLAASVWRGAISREDANLDARRATLVAELDRMSGEEARPNNALQAKTQRLLIDLYAVFEKTDPVALDVIWDRASNIIDAAEPLGDYPFERFVNIIRLLGDLGIESETFDALFEKTLTALEKRRSEVAGAELLAEKAHQKLAAEKIYDAIRLFGRALERLSKHESRHDLISLLMGLCVAYEHAGLLWAARNCALVAVERSLASFLEHARIDPIVIPCLKKLVWLELQLGRLPRIIEEAQLLSMTLFHLDVSEERRESLAKEWELLDAIMGILILGASLDQLKALEKFPDVFERLGLFLPKAALLYALGYRGQLRQEGFPKEHFSDDDIDRFMKRMMEQPAKTQLPELPNLMEGQTVEFRSNLLGCSLVIISDNNEHSVYLAEAIIGAIEAFFATSLDQRIFPYRSDATIKVSAADDAPTPFALVEENKGSPHFLTVRHPPRKVEHTDAYREKYRDMVMEVIARVLVHLTMIENVEAYFDAIAGKERGFSRALAFSEIDTVSENIFGHTPRAKLASFVLEGDKAYPLMRSTKWSEGVEFEAARLEPEQDRPGSRQEHEAAMDRFSEMSHRARKVISVIDVPLWDKAEWSGTLYTAFSVGQPPVIGFGFRDIDAGREIFRGLRAKVGRADYGNKLRISILTGVDRMNPAFYNVVVNANIPQDAANSSQLLMFVARRNQMTPSSSANLDGFLRLIGPDGRFYISPVLFDGDATTHHPVDMTLAIEKAALNVRPAWQIGLNDPDAMGISSLDDPIIPEGESNAPVLELLKILRKRTRVEEPRA